MALSSRVLLFISVVLVFASGCKGGRDGRDGVPCTIEPQDGGATIRCESENVLVPFPRDGADGQGCTAELSNDIVNVTCGDVTEAIPLPRDGADGQGCTTETVDGGVNVICGNDRAFVPNPREPRDGNNGEGCVASEFDGGIHVTCGDTVAIVPVSREGDSVESVEPTCVVAPSGDSDATTAIQSCIDEIGAAGGGTVLLGDGEYVLRSNHLRFAAGAHDYVRLQGVGERTVLRLADGLRTSAILIGTDQTALHENCSDLDSTEAVTGVHIERLRIVGNLDPSDWSDCCPASDEDFGVSTEWLDCETYGPDHRHLTRNGVTVRCATDVRVSDFFVEHVNSGGVVADRARGLVVERGKIVEPLIDCFASNFTDGTVVRDVECYRPGWAGLNGDPATRMTLERNAVSETGTLTCPGKNSERPGLYLVGVDDSMIVGNTIADTSGAGIEFHGSSGNVVAQNHIARTSKVGIALDIRDGCTGGSSNNALVANIIVDGADRPIWAICPSVDNQASGNVCAGHPDNTALITLDCGCDGLEPLEVVSGCGG